MLKHNITGCHGATVAVRGLTLSVLIMVKHIISGYPRLPMALRGLIGKFEIFTVYEI
jgi:hypothetical protein